MQTEDSNKRRHNNTIIKMGNHPPPPPSPPPKKKNRKGAQNVFTLGHIQLNYDSKQAMNLQGNRPYAFLELVWTKLPID